jgi:ribosomal protein S18 acetylase RimI-like enzyme
MAVGAPVEVRRAEPADFRALAAMLARAFHDDPLTRWLHPNPRSRPRQARRTFAVRLRQLAPQGQTYTTAERSGAALWTLPGRWRDDLAASLRFLPLLPPMLPRLGRIAQATARIEAAHPRVPHFYLSVLGCDPATQGCGVGSALLRPVLERCDAERVPAYLETATERNVGWYARHGFAVRQRLELPGGAPALWLLWREPE